MEEIISHMGDRSAVLAREMTKLHEEFIRGSVSEILETIRARPQIKGECTLLVAGRQPEGEAVGRAIVKAEIKTALAKQQSGLSEIARTIAKKYGLSKNEVYQIALKLRARNQRPKSENRSE